MVKISFILPVYRAEQYIERVVGALKAQTLKEFEAIFVDDGSPDSSASLCRRLFREDERFKLITKENGGVSSARNTGLDAATGKYIFFVDPDDTLEAESAELLWETAERENADIVFFGRVNDYYSNGTLVKSEESLPKVEGVFRDNPCQRLFDKIATSYFVTDKLFKREIIEEHGLRFQNMNIGEDGVFFAEYLRCGLKCAVFLQNVLYRYTVNVSGSLSTAYHSERISENFRLSEAMRKTAEVWGESRLHEKTLEYCTVRDLQLGIKNINLSDMPFFEKCAWLKKITADKWVRMSVRGTALSMAESRNDKIKLLLLKLHLYRTTVFVSSLSQKRGKK